MRIGSRFMVFLCEYKIIQEALQNPAFANRPDVVTFMGIGEDIGKYGKRYDLNDKNLIDFQNKLKEFEQCGSGMIVVDIFPWLRSIIPEFILDRLSKKNKYMEIVNQFTTWFKTEVNDHMKTLDSTNPRDFIDEYLIEMEKQKDNPDNVMSCKYFYFNIH
ncbi:cytochrome P450 2C28, partial [Armadillidium vulgare]